MKRMKKRTGVIVLVVFLAVLVALGYYSLSILKSMGMGKDRNLKLGLDLAGGVSITYEVVGETPSAEDMKDTIYKLQKRIESDLGEDTKTTEASVYQVGDNRITVEIPGVSDANAILEELGTPGKLYFIKHKDSDGNENYSYDSSKGEYVLNKTIDELQENGGIVLDGSEVKSATATYEQDQTTKASEPVVQISLNDEGTTAFADATAEAYADSKDTIGIYYDDRFVSVPAVQASITDGNAVINGMSDFSEAENLASYIRIGGLNLELKELQSEVVGAQLGSNALSTSYMAAGIGLLLVFVFMIIVYQFPGFIASLALILYTELIVSILYLFDITLTLPGIAGIILSIGMAVDANVIIFSRIREELRDGKSLLSACGSGFHRAMSAIIDGNVTTLIAAAVLGIMGTGTVKGFAITLALGVVLSMFTALIITRLLMQSFLSVGVDNVKIYGKARPEKRLEFINKRFLFFFISIALIACGIIAMIANSAMGKKALNYSLEFSGGTATTVNFDKEYTIEEIESDIVPVVAKVTGDNDIQTQKVNNGNSVIIKTRTLNLTERESLNKALEDNFGVKEDAISSENISSTISGEMRSTSVRAVIVAVIFMLLYIWVRFRDFRLASSAIIALGHDVLVTLTMYALFRLSVGSAFIACILTVIGYSVNDTIVIFDRLRENYRSLRVVNKDTLKDLANDSISQTLSRSLSTSITTALTITMLLILGVSSVKEFAFPLLVGVACGTYSSICIATELWYIMKVHFPGKGGLDKQIQKKKKPAAKATKENGGLVV